MKRGESGNFCGNSAREEVPMQVTVREKQTSKTLMTQLNKSKNINMKGTHVGKSGAGLKTYRIRSFDKFIKVAGSSPCTKLLARFLLIMSVINIILKCITEIPGGPSHQMTGESPQTSPSPGGH